MNQLYENPLYEIIKPVNEVKSWVDKLDNFSPRSICATISLGYTALLGSIIGLCIAVG